MRKNYLTKAIEKYFKEYQSRKISSTDLEKGVALLLEMDKSGNYITEEIKKQYIERLNEIRVKENAKKEKSLAKISKVKSYSGMKKGMVTGFTLCATTVAIVATSWGCSNSEEKEVAQVAQESTISSEIGNNIVKVAKDNEISKQMNKEVVQEKVLSASLAFDPNDNKELVERMTKFVVDSLNSGIAIKDFMTDEEVETAKKADATSVITLEQLMDYYFVLNVEDIDPEDYARLGYKTKTTDTIIENYQNVANEYSMDLLTIDYSNLIDYSEIVAHKDSAKAINDFNNLVAKLNTSSNKQEVIEETREYVNTNYITNEANIYSMPANEQVYRSMFSFDILTNGKGITKDMGIILMEDGTYTCEKATQKGVKNESERAQEATNIRNIVEDKLEESRKYYTQNLTNISEYELKTGVELENEIKEKALEKNAVYVANPVYKTAEVVTEKKNSTKKTQTTQQQPTVTEANPSNVIGDNGLPIDLSQFTQFNINPEDPNAKAIYEQAVKAQTEQDFYNSDEHVIRDTEGKVIYQGSEADAEDHNQKWANGYHDGNSGKSPASDDPSYMDGWKNGKADLDKLNSSLLDETHYESVPDGSEETISETVIEQDYTGDTDNYGDVDVTVDYDYGDSSEEIVITEEFIPVEDGAEEIISETVKLEEYNAPRTIEAKELKREEKVSNDTNDIQLKYLNALKALITESSKIVEDTEEVLNRMR